MASDNNIKGLKIEIGTDTVGFEKGLKALNTESKKTQTELEQVNRLLKLDPTNTELLAQKQKLLAQGIEQTQIKVEALKKAKDTADKDMQNGTEINEQQYRKLQREIAASEINIKNLSDETKKFENVTEQATEKSTRNYEKLGGVANKLLGTIAGLGAGIFASAVKAGQSADDINTLSKITGLTTEEIQKFAYAADRIDVDINTLTGSFAKLIKNMSAATKGSGNAYDAFVALGVSFQNIDGSLRNKQDVFDEVISKLAEMENETQRDAYAMQIFGKSAQELNPLILGGTEDLKKYGEEAKKAGLILSQEALDGANEFADGIDKLKATATAATAKIGTAFTKNFLPAVEKGIKGIEKWSVVLIDNKEKLVSGAAGIAAFAGTIKAMQFVNYIKSLEGATIAQKALNLATKSFPGALIATAIAGTVAAIASYVIKTKEATAEEKKAQEEHKKRIQAMKEERDSWYDLIKTRKDKIEGDLTEIENIKRLYNELRTLVNENGKVIKGNEERVKFIIEKINPALDSEIKLTGNQIQNYKDTQTEITKMIELKKAQIVLEAREADYKEALTKIGEKQREQALRNLEIEKDKVDIESLLGAKAYAQSKEGQKRIDELKKQLKDKEAAYNANDQVVNDYYKAIGEYQALELAISEKNYSKMNALLTQYSTNFKTHGNANKQELQKQLQENTIIFETLKKKYEEGVPYVTKKMVEDAKAILDKSSEEFVKAGGTIPTKVSEGLKSTKNNFDTYMEQEFTSTGSKISTNIANGINNNKSIVADTIKGVTSVDLSEQGKKAGESFINAYNNLAKKFAPADPSNLLGYNKSSYNSYSPFVMRPQMAKGGTLHEGEAIVAEAGPEIIQLKNGKAHVTPLSSTAHNTPIKNGNIINQYFTNSSITAQQIKQMIQSELGGAY